MFNKINKEKKEEKLNLPNRTNLNGIVDIKTEKMFFSMFCLTATRCFSKKFLKELKNYFWQYIILAQKMSQEKRTLQELFSALPHNQWAEIRKRGIYTFILKNEKTINKQPI